MNYKTLIMLVFVLFLASNCTTSPRSKSSSSTQGSGQGTPTPATLTADMGTPVADGPYTQAASATGGKVDVLFVLDGSSSMVPAREKVSQAFSTFVGEFLNISSVNVAFLLAWGSPDPNGGYEGSGHLYRVGANPHVLSARLSEWAEMETLQTKLAETLALAPPDQPVPNPQDSGELGMYAVQRLVTTPALADEAKRRGFLNDGAALVVIFLSDENDICAIYPSEESKPPWVPSAERTLHDYCPNGIAGADLFAAAKALKGDDPVQFDGLVFTSPVSTDLYDTWEWEMGYGYLDAIAASNGVSADFGAVNYTEGLRNFGNAINSAVAKLQRKFFLTRTSVNPLSIKVYVNDALVTFTYLSVENAVVLDYAGQNGSTIRIDYRVL